MLADLQAQYQEEGLKVVAVNIDRSYSVAEWASFWQSTGAGDVLWAQDVTGASIEEYRLVALGTEIVLDRQGRVVLRSNGPAGYARLQAAIEETL